MNVQLVNENGETIGHAPKMDAHHGGGRLHRAVSVMVRRPQDGALLIQRRAAEKYHFGGLWANSCCSHPYQEETPFEAAQRALRHELGICSEPQEVSAFVYRAEDAESSLVEHEYDHVFIADWECEAMPNDEEVAEVRWLKPEELEEALEERSHCFVPWLSPVFQELKSAGCLVA